MIKKCLGCGVKLQDKDDTSCGYVSSMDKDLCTRCFKIKHYIKELVLIIVII